MEPETAYMSISVDRDPS